MKASTIPLLCLALALTAGNTAIAKCKACDSTAKLAYEAAKREAKSEYCLEAGKANYLPTKEERKEALNDAKDDLAESLDEARDQFDARKDLCDALDECRYHPEIIPGDFLSPAQAAANPNQYMPLIPGTTNVYEGVTAEGTETIRVVVTDETRDILGVTCTVVRDTGWLDGELVEDTWDWFAQDIWSNVWYFGELSFEYEDGEIASLEGSWEAGVDGAKPGIVMEGNPLVGDIYRQEFLLGEAEDAAEVVGLNQSVTVPLGTYNNCLMTGEFTPIEPDVYENKYYAPGVGLVLEVDTESGDMIELIGH